MTTEPKRLKRSETARRRGEPCAVRVEGFEQGDGQGDGQSMAEVMAGMIFRMFDDTAPSTAAGEASV